MTAGIKRVTTNYKLKIPYFDTPLWGTPVEQNYDVIDALLYAGINIVNFVGLWLNNTVYLQGQRVADSADGSLWECNINHTSAISGTFADDRFLHPTYWTSFNAQVLLVTTSDAAPIAPLDGTLWWDTVNAKLYLWYEDGDSGQWVQISGTPSMSKLISYTVATVPSVVSVTTGSMIYVSDESGGAVPAFSDGTNWRRVTDRAVIS